MRKTRHSFAVYPPCYRPGDKLYRVSSIFQAKKRAIKLGVGSEVWRYTRTLARKDDPFLAMTTTNAFEFELWRKREA